LCGVQEAEVAEVTAAYQRLEKVVSSHLVGLQRAMESTVPLPQSAAGQATQPIDKAVDISALSASCQDENVYNTMNGYM
jgi:hypothetical protein